MMVVDFGGGDGQGAKSSERVVTALSMSVSGHGNC